MRNIRQVQTADTTQRFLDRLAAVGLRQAATHCPELRADRVAGLMAEIGRNLLIELAGSETYFPMRLAIAKRNAEIRAAFEQPGPGAVAPRSRARALQLASEHGLSERHVLRLTGNRAGNCN